jgi:predicted phage tail protein
MFQRLFALLFITAVLSEPECSRFHYEEQTLNKMIRQEIAMEKLQADMAAIQQQVLDTLGKLTETTQQLSDDWKNEEIKLERVTNDFMEETNKSIQTEMTKLKRVTNDVTEETNKSIRNFAADLEKLKGKIILNLVDIIFKLMVKEIVIVFSVVFINKCSFN